MNYKQITSFLLTFTALFCFFGDVTAQQTADKFERTAALSAGENVVLQWNRVLQETIRTPGQQPATIMPVRSFAMMHAAIFDAVNSIDGRYTPYLYEVPNSPWVASVDAAAAKAAHDVLVALYPTRQAVFDAELNVSLAGINRTRARLGMGVGETVAQAILAARANDGWNATPPPYVLPPTPGNWQPIAPSTAATFTHYPTVLPFAVGSNTRFAPNLPPALTSDEYARDFNEVKDYGSATSTVRSADQTKVAQLWQNLNTPTTVFFVWNNVARSIAISRNASTAENARLFALLNIAFHDTLGTTFAGKFQHGMWRPTTAIRRADEDGNPNTTQDVNWSALMTTPPYPSYPGNHAAIGASQSTILALFFGRDDIPFQHTWEGAGGATRSYVGFAAMAQEEADSRIYAGFHYRFDNVAGQSAGRNVANYVFLTSMRPRNGNF